MKKFLTILAITAAIVSCKKNTDEPPSNALVDPGNPDAIYKALVFLSGDDRTGTFPTPTGTAQSPVVSLSSANSYTTSNGSTLPITFLYSNLNGAIGGVYFRVDGAAKYRNITSIPGSGGNGSISISLGIPQNVDSGLFSISFCIYDASNRVSNIIKRNIRVVRLGTGAIQINLAWDTDNSDVDLHLTEPTGNEIYFLKTTSPSGGFLDRDDVDGFGPENIFFQNNMADGLYKVSLVYYATHGITAPTNCIVTINSPGKSRTFTKTLTIASISTKYPITDINKSGSTYTY